MRSIKTRRVAAIGVIGPSLVATSLVALSQAAVARRRSQACTVADGRRPLARLRAGPARGHQSEDHQRHVHVARRQRLARPGDAPTTQPAHVQRSDHDRRERSPG